jgi:1-acyl-sn-glycerol-3-phosphate acyltransferase
MLDNYAISAYAIYKTLAISAPTVVEASLGRLSPETCDARLRKWSRSLIERAKVDLEVTGLEKVPRHRAFVVMSNHQSHFDIPILYRLWPGRLRMVAKIELFRVPIWGRAMRVAGFVPVDRTGGRQRSQAALAQAAEALEQGTSIWIAPEGTRSMDGRLGPFKKGGFRLAIDTGAPIVPIALDGSIDIIRKKTKLVHRGVRVRATVGAPVEVSDRSLDDLLAEVRGFLSSHLSNP